MLQKHSAHSRVAACCKWCLFTRPKNGSKKIFLIFVKARFFMMHFTQQQSMIPVGVLLLNPISIMISDHFCPYTSTISVLQREMKGNVLEQRKWTQMVITILRRRSINTTAKLKCSCSPAMSWFVFLRFLSSSWKKNICEQKKKLLN